MRLISLALALCLMGCQRKPMDFGDCLQMVRGFDTRPTDAAIRICAERFPAQAAQGGAK